MAQDFVVNATGAGDTTLVEAPGPNRFIRVLNYHLTANATATATLKSGSTTKSVEYLNTGNSVQPNDSDTGIFDCAVNEPLVLTVSAGNVGGSGKYTVEGGRTYN